MKRAGIVLALLSALLTAAGASSQPAPPREPLSSLWRRAVPGVVEVAVSTDGSRTFTADGQGRLSCFDAAGEPLWTVPLPGINRIATSRQGTLTAAYGARRPLYRKVHLLDAAGKVVHVLENDAPIESAIVSPGGHLVAVAAGRTLTLCSRTGTEVRQKRIPLEGTVRQIQFGPGDSVYVAAQEPDYVALVKSTGKVLWKRQSTAGAAFAIAASEDGKLLGIGSQRADGTVAVSVVDAKNERLWSAPRPGRAPRVRISLDGSAVLLAYEHKVEHGNESRFERRLAYFGTPLQQSWTKGGHFSAPLCVAIHEAGDWVVVLDNQSSHQLPRFRLYGERGERRWLYTSEAPVLIAAGAPAGKHFAVYRADGILEMIQVTP